MNTHLAQSGTAEDEQDETHVATAHVDEMETALTPRSKGRVLDRWNQRSQEHTSGARVPQPNEDAPQHQMEVTYAGPPRKSPSIVSNERPNVGGRWMMSTNGSRDGIFEEAWNDLQKGNSTANDVPDLDQDRPQPDDDIGGDDVSDTQWEASAIDWSQAQAPPLVKEVERDVNVVGSHGVSAPERSSRGESDKPDLSNPSKILQALHGALTAKAPVGGSDFSKPTKIIETFGESPQPARANVAKLPKPTRSWKKNANSKVREDSSVLGRSHRTATSKSFVVSSRSSAFDAWDSQRDNGPSATATNKDVMRAKEAKKTGSALPKKPQARNHLPAPVIRRPKKKNAASNGFVDSKLSDIAEATTEETNESATPRAREMITRKRELQAQRRRKSGSSMVDEVDLCNSSSLFGSVATESLSWENGANRPGQAVEPHPTGSGRRADYVGEASEYTPFRVSGPTSNWLGGSVSSTAPLSPGAGSDTNFSFLSENGSIKSTVSGHGSHVSGSSLTNRAEKALQLRRRKQRGAFLPTQDENDEQVARDHATSETNMRRPLSQSKNAPRLSNRYNTSSRFVQPGSPARTKDTATFSLQESVEETVGTESLISSYHSMGTLTTEWTENDSQYFRNKSKRREALLKNLSQPSDVASDTFLSENATNFKSFRDACKNISFSDVASDIVGEFGLLDFQTLAKRVNDKVSGCMTEKTTKGCTRLVPFDDEDVAIEVEYMEGDSNSIEDDPRRDFGVCAALDDAVRPSTSVEYSTLGGGACALGKSWEPDHDPSVFSEAPRYQYREDGTREAYV